MKTLATYLLIVPLLLSSFAAFTQTKQTDSTANYTYKNGDPNGIGKWYLGREIAYVMGFPGINWLERSDREEEELVSQLIANINIKPTDIIADIGAGSGYHVFRMAPLANKGSIYAVDIQEQMLAAMEAKKTQNGVENVQLILGSEKSVNLPVNSVDKVLMVDVYHEFSYPKEMIASIKKALRPNGQIYLIEYRGEDDWVPIKKVHKMTEAQTVKEMQAAGFSLKENLSNLPWQHCMVFVKQ